jgi:COMPASS component SPP1
VTVPAEGSSSKRTRKASYTETGEEDDDIDCDDEKDEDYVEDDEPSRGGSLKRAELRGLVSNVKSVKQFRSLGESILSASQSNGTNGEHNEVNDITYTPEELQEFENIASQRNQLLNSSDRLNYRLKFYERVRTRKADVLAKLKQKDSSYKEICGFDPRLSVSDAEFDELVEDPQIKKSLSHGEALPPPTLTDGEMDTDDAFSRGVCLAKKCQQHLAWVNNFRLSVTGDQQRVVHELDELEKEEKSIRERAVLRGLEAKQS